MFHIDIHRLNIFALVSNVLTLHLFLYFVLRSDQAEGNSTRTFHQASGWGEEHKGDRLHTPPRQRRGE